MDVPKQAPPPGARGRIPIVAGAVLVSVLALTAWIGLGGTDSGQRLEFVVERKLIEFPIDALGSLQPKSVVVLALEVDGTVRELLVSPGDRISKGQRIAVLANDRLLAEVEAARYRSLQADAQYTVVEATAEAQSVDEKAALARSRAALRFAESEHSARKASFEKGVISRLSLEESLARLDVARADHEAAQLRAQAGRRLRAARSEVEGEVRRSAKDSLERLVTLKSKLDVTAPATGVLSTLSLEVGQALTAGTKIGRVIGSEGFIAVLRIPEDLAPMVGPGTSARLELGSETFEGRVVRVSPVVEQGFRLVEVAIEDADSRLAAFADQTSLRATLQARTEEALLSIQYAEGISPGQVIPMLALPENGPAEARDIVLGARLGDRIIVRSGAVSGERLAYTADGDAP